ncbi:Hypothetical protein NTJ_05353 [Nesidiocoris tenuis]|uniref:Uncharacterized protein n=1 Tax=Nesidiocoris tenuis TaxID=355587 RepID=A0ABN7AJX8_9HEMI|nr:Hypothetical protein NTJ_05353 [Nesidiocoris tenuis]
MLMLCGGRAWLMETVPHHNHRPGFPAKLEAVPIASVGYFLLKTLCSADREIGLETPLPLGEKRGRFGRFLPDRPCPCRGWIGGSPSPLRKKRNRNIYTGKSELSATDLRRKGPELQHFCAELELISYY